MNPKEPLNNPLSEIQKQITSLVQAVEKLRGPGGCPWDQEQTHQSLAPYALEEVCELLEALDTVNYSLMKEELGDVLFQVVLHSELAREAGLFTLADVSKEITDKIIRRHPHVFSDVKVSGTEEVLKNWEIIKQQEKVNAQAKMSTTKKPASTTGEIKVYSEERFKIQPHLPALSVAHKIGDKTERNGFDWPDIHGVLLKLDEEIQELKEEIKNSSSSKKIEHELGDVLFSVAQISRHLNLDAESALRKTNYRFEKRYFTMLMLAEQDGKIWEKLNLKEKENYWTKSKELLKPQEENT